MWDKDGKEHLKKHLHYKKLRDKGGETSQDEKGEFTDDKSHTELQANDKTQMDLNYDNIQYSMGVANIMNKYNFSSTSDIKNYNNKNVSIKSKKKTDGKGVYNETLIFVQKKEAKRTLANLNRKKRCFRV